MDVFLLHGMARTALSMGLLARRLGQAGHRCHLFGYQVLSRDLDAIRERFEERVRGDVGAGGEAEGPARYALVGHSLGGVIARMAAPALPAGLERLILLGSPTRTPIIARKLSGNPLFKAFTGDAGQRLADHAFFERLPPLDVPTLVIAGTRGPGSSWLPFAGDPNDGIVRLAETRLAGAREIAVHGAHTFLMNRRDVTREVLSFLDSAAPPPGQPGNQER